MTPPRSQKLYLNVSDDVIIYAHIWRCLKRCLGRGKVPRCLKVRHLKMHVQFAVEIHMKITYCPTINQYACPYLDLLQKIEISKSRKITLTNPL